MFNVLFAMKTKEVDLQRGIVISQNNPSNYVVLADGRIVYNAQIFVGYSALINYFRLRKKTLLFIDNLRPLYI